MIARAAATQEQNVKVVEGLFAGSQGWLDAYSGMLESSLSVFSRVSKVDPGASDRG